MDSHNARAAMVTGQQVSRRGFDSPARVTSLNAPDLTRTPSLNIADAP